MVTVDEKPSAVYDLQGRRIVNGTLQRGIYIVGGKKRVLTR